MPMKQNKKQNKVLPKIFLTAVALLIMVGGILFYILWINLRIDNDLADNYDKIADQKLELVSRKLDGVLVENGLENNLPVAVMIENHVDSRPPSGLVEAKLVYEVLAEGEITRFLAFYDLTEQLAKIGPIRSARPYYIDLASEYQAIYAHSGASPQAWEILRHSLEVFDLDEFFHYNAQYFWRDSSRYAPHNLYTSTALLTQAKMDNNWPELGDFTSWQFKDKPSTIASSTISTININFSAKTHSYQVTWFYNSQNNNFERQQASSYHSDDQGNIVTADNLIIQYVPTRAIDEVGRKSMDLVGGGDAVFYLDGQKILGRWERLNKNSRTHYFDLENREIIFNRGQIWIEIVPYYLKLAVVDN